MLLIHNRSSGRVGTALTCSRGSVEHREDVWLGLVLILKSERCVLNSLGGQFNLTSFGFFFYLVC